MVSPAIVLIDPLGGGHRPAYLERLCVMLLRAGRKVAAVTPDTDALARRVAESGADSGGRFRAYEYNEPPTVASGLIRNVLRATGRWMRAAGHVRSAWRDFGGPAPDVLFTWMDIYVQARLPPVVLDRVFPFRWTGIYFHPRVFRLADAGATRRRRSASVFRARRCGGVGVLDGGVIAALSEACAGKPVIHVPDVADDAAPDRDDPIAVEIRRRAAGRVVVGLVGALAARKGIRTLLQVADRVAPEEWLFVLVGDLVEKTFEPRELARLREIAGNGEKGIYAHFGRIPGEAQFNAVIEACDVLFAAYERFPHSSNLLAKAALFKKPVVVSRGYYMEELVRRYHLGAAIDEGDASQCVQALDAIRKDLGAGRIAGYGFDAYLREHSQERFEEAVMRLVGS